MPLADLVLATAVGLAPAGLVALAHGGSSFRRVMPRGSGGEALGGPQAGAPGAWVGLDLAAVGVSERSGQEAQAGVPAAHADRELGGTDAAASLGGEEALDDPVLERVVAEDDEAAARPEQVEGGGEALLERVELLVDGDPQRLEDAGRRMGPARLARVRRDDALDERGELLGRR